MINKLSITTRSNSVYREQYTD